MRRIAFFFIGADRKGMLEAVRRGELPDSSLRGAHFFAGHPGWTVDLISTHSLEARIPRFWRPFLPMSLVQLAFVPRLMKYDAVIASDGFLLGCAVSLLGRFRRTRPKWILIAINTSVLIKRHSTHPIRRRALRFCWNRFAAIVCLSRAQQLDLVQFGVREHLLSTIHFGVDTKYWSQTTPRGQRSILSIGKDYGRDYATLLDAAARTGLPVTIIASRKNISEVRIPENVTIRYDVPIGELRDIYSDARFIVIASVPDGTALGSDCSGQTVMLESLAAGCAAIATERAWLSEYLSPGKDYCAVPAGDARSLAEAVRELWENKSKRELLAAHGARTVRERYSSKRFAEDLAALVEKLLS